MRGRRPGAPRGPPQAVAGPLSAGPCHLPSRGFHADTGARRTLATSVQCRQSLPHLGGGGGTTGPFRRPARGRRAAVAGLTSIAISSAAVNVPLKRLSSRERPDRVAAGVVFSRQTRMPESASFPSGHSASGFAFATAVGHQVPVLSFPLEVLAAAVAYSRVHSGVHYPGDAIVGSLAGAVVGLMVGARFSRRGSVKP